MMTQAAERIQSRLNILIKEKNQLDQQIKNMHKKDKGLKSDMHRIELKILTESQHTDPSQKVDKLFHEVNKLRHNRHDLHEDQRALRTLTTKVNELTKKITTHQFWMKYANNDDPLKQADAIRHVFG